MSVTYSFGIYIGTDADDLIQKVQVETKREPRFSQFTGERIEDHVESETVFTQKDTSRLFMQSDKLVRIGRHDEFLTADELMYVYAYDLQDDVIALPFYDDGTIHNSSLSGTKLSDYLAKLADVEAEFRRLTGYTGDLRVFYLKSVSY